MTEKMLIAGFGGQGVILAGKLVAYAGMLEGRNVSHIPSYGVEMRGGTANCHVTVSDQEVASPFVPHPTTLIAMNKPSLDKFEESVIPGGNIFINSSLIERRVERDDVNVYYLPANNIAEEAGTGKASNMAMLGALVAVTGIVSMESLKRSLPEMVSKRNIKFNEINVQAMDMGHDYMYEVMMKGE
jgi:2-oxoglutarate ferredoxin oxidoreductase subunit gamma